MISFDLNLVSIENTNYWQLTINDPIHAPTGRNTKVFLSPNVTQESLTSFLKALEPMEADKQLYKQEFEYHPQCKFLRRDKTLRTIEAKYNEMTNNTDPSHNPPRYTQYHTVDLPVFDPFSAYHVYSKNSKKAHEFLIDYFSQHEGGYSDFCYLKGLKEQYS